MTDPDPPPPTPSPEADAADAIADLRERILATKEAAERLHAQAEDARAAEDGGGAPANGWATPEERTARADEVHALAELVRALRELVPHELRAQVTEVLRQLLLLVRAIIDWWVDRLELEGTPARRAADGPAPAPRVEDIPIGS